MSADTVNQVIQGGRLGADAEVRYTADGNPVVHFRLAVSLRVRVDGEWKDDTNWWRVTCFGKLADRYVERPLLKGHRVLVFGRMEKVSIYNGERGSGVNLGIVANEIARYDFDERESAPQRSTTQPRPQRQTVPDDDVQDLTDLPF